MISVLLEIVIPKEKKKKKKCIYKSMTQISRYKVLKKPVSSCVFCINVFFI